MSGSNSKISLFFLTVIALLGVFLRLYPFLGLPLEYEHLLHAHSHTAFQGWIYTAMMLLLANLFLSKKKSNQVDMPFNSN